MGSTWQFSVCPVAPQCCGATPTDLSPFLITWVSSAISTVRGAGMAVRGSGEGREAEQPGGVPEDVAKRLIDFASGLTYALDGGMQRIADKVFLLTPPNVDVRAG